MDGPPAKKGKKEDVVAPITFPYKLDVFQEESIAHLERGDSVLVSAHTSAGKTTVALYAIAMALRQRRRVIYTSPIKALSNQKFREFGEKFPSVGLMTGDITIKSEADCLVMTTEILRSMLYRGTEMLREVGVVVFDEVHYMRDKSRGVVWEETIIMLPEGCQYVFLSATIPNATEFAQWVESIHPKTICRVVHTNYRPVPLQHYLYPVGADGIFLVVDEKGNFRDDNYRNAMAAVGSDVNNEGGGDDRPKRLKSKKGQQPIMDIIRLAMDRSMYPIIVFAFVKSDCERNALSLARLNFNTADEEALVTEVFQNAMECLAEDDRTLPAIIHLLPLLRRGVGIHHSGLLPILKEVVELLFQVGLVKVLFATETFSMGLNMPARTVVFAALRKFDGEKSRTLTSGEYIQMSGRAGRRGLDSVGVVIAVVDEPAEHDTMKALMSGAADTLNSSFHLTYSMVLNLLRVDDADPEYMLVRSFAQYQRLRHRPALERRISELEESLAALAIPEEAAEVIDQFLRCTSVLEAKRQRLKGLMRAPRWLMPFMKAGRLVKICRASDGTSFGWCIVRSVAGATREGTELVEVFAPCKKIQASATSQAFVPCSIVDYTTDTADVYTMPVSLGDIDCASRLVVTLPPSPSTEMGRMQIAQTLSKLHKAYGDEVPLLTGEELGIEGPEWKKLTAQVESLKAQLEANEYVAHPTPALQSAFDTIVQRREFEAQLETVRAELEGITQAVLTNELKAMMRVLRRLDYVDAESVVMRKARVACEITTTDENEILLTELLFRGSFIDLETEMIVALLSCLVNVHRTPDNFSLPEAFHAPLAMLNELVQRINTVCAESGIVTDQRQQDSRVMPSLMEVTYLWAQGAKFSEIVKRTTAYEGDIVRMMRRLEEMLRQLAGAARSPAIGSEALSDKFAKGIQLIKRDIVFASSLYL